jgi:hypothetical protein
MSILNGVLSGLLNNVFSEPSNPFARFKRPSIAYKTPDYTMTTETVGATVAMTDTGFNSTTTGGTIIFEFDMSDWAAGSGNQGIFQIGDTTTNYLSFFLTSSGNIRALPLSGGAVQQDGQWLRSVLDITGQRSSIAAKWRLGFTMRPDGTYAMSVNGTEMSYMTSGYTLPAITTSSNVYIGLVGGTNQINALTGFSPSKVEFYNTPMTRAELQENTIPSSFISGDTYDADEYSIAGFGQSNCASIASNSAPVGFTFTATNAFKNAKNATHASYSSPYASNPSALPEFATAGGWSWMDFVLNSVGNANATNKFGSTVACESGVGFYLGSDNFGYANSGNSYFASRELISACLFLLASYTRSNPYLFVIRGGETDAETGGVSGAGVKTALDNAMRAFRPFIGNSKVIVSGLSATPASGFAGWATVNTALSEWATTNNYDFIDASGFAVNTAPDDYHLSSAGQKSFGEAVVALI